MHVAPSIRVNVRNFTGTVLPFHVDPTRPISELKAQIAANGKGKSVRVPCLAYKGHEMRDMKRLDHYGVVANDVLHILPPSDVPTITLEFEKDDGTVFSLAVKSDIKVRRLKQEINIEEKIVAKQLKVVTNQEDADGDEVITLQELLDDKAISDYSLEGQKIIVDDSIWETVSPPSALGILLSIDERMEGASGKRMGVAVKLDQTLGSFKQHLLDKHGILCSDYTLILIGRELKDDNMALGDLGFIPGCTVHAVATVQFSVSTPSAGDFEFALKAMTRISEIRELLKAVDADTPSPYDEYALSLDGVHTLRETRTLWDLNIFSGTMFILKNRCSITLSLNHFGRDGRFNRPDEITLDESETLDNLNQQILKLIDPRGRGRIILHLFHRRKKLVGSNTLKQEGLEGGDVVDVHRSDSEDAPIKGTSRLPTTAPPEKHDQDMASSHANMGADELAQTVRELELSCANAAPPPRGDTLGTAGEHTLAQEGVLAGYLMPQPPEAECPAYAEE